MIVKVTIVEWSDEKTNGKVRGDAFFDSSEIQGVEPPANDYEHSLAKARLNMRDGRSLPITQTPEEFYAQWSEATGETPGDFIVTATTIARLRDRAPTKIIRKVYSDALLFLQGAFHDIPNEYEDGMAFQDALKDPEKD